MKKLFYFSFATIGILFLRLVLVFGGGRLQDYRRAEIEETIVQYGEVKKRFFDQFKNIDYQFVALMLYWAILLTIFAYYVFWPLLVNNHAIR